MYRSLYLLHLIKVHVQYHLLQEVCLPLFNLVLYLVKLYLLLIHSVQGPIRPHQHLYHSFLVVWELTQAKLALRVTLRSAHTR